MAVADHFETVQKIYIAFYQRPADPAGLKYWAESIEAAGGDISAVINSFATSAEATSLYGEINEETIGAAIDRIYQGLFGRDADEAGKAYYEAEFAAGNITAGNIALAVLSGAQNEDENAVANKVAVANEFTKQVDGRDFTDAAFGTAPFNVTYSGNEDAAAARGILAAVTADAATVLTPAQVTAALRSEIADEGDPIGDLPLSEALAAYEAAVENQEAAADAYAAVLAEAGDYGVTEGEDGSFDDFNAETDYVAQAEAAVQTEVAALASARASVGSDAAVNAAVTQAQAAINAYTAQRFDEAGTVATDGTTYSLAQLQVRATNAQAALDANLAANGETADLAQELNDAVALYLSTNSDVTVDDVAVLASLQAAIATFRAEGGDEAVFLDAVATANAAIFSGEDDASVLATGARGDAVESLVTTLDARNTASDNATARQAAFEAAEETAAGDAETFEDVTFVGGATDLTSALEVQTERQELLDNLETAQTELAAIEDAAEAYADAVQQVADAEETLGYEIRAMNETALLADEEEAELFLFDADEDLTGIAVNGLGDDDVIFLGAEYTLGTEGSANNNVLEVFLTEVDGNAVLQIENSVYGSSVGDGGDFTTITLTGIAAEGVSIEGGIVTFA